jgi:hypothetical protein
MSAGSLHSVIAVAGRRIDAADAKPSRFPFKKVGAVRSALLQTFVDAAPLLIVGSAACGSDLLALDAASVMGIRTRIVLPFSPEIFRETSVVDRPEPAYWGGLYDRLIAEARKRGDLLVLGRDRDDTNVYVATNKAILRDALLEATKKAPTVRPRCIVVWEGAPRGDDDVTEDFRRLAVQSGFAIEVISSL